MFGFPVGNRAGKLEAVEKPLGLLLRPAIVDNRHSLKLSAERLRYILHRIYLTLSLSISILSLSRSATRSSSKPDMVSNKRGIGFEAELYQLCQMSALTSKRWGPSCSTFATSSINAPMLFGVIFELPFDR